MTIKPANKGRPKANTDLPVFFESAYKIGAKITKATSKKTGIDMMEYLDVDVGMGKEILNMRLEIRMKAR